MVFVPTAGPRVHLQSPVLSSDNTNTLVKVRVRLWFQLNVNKEIVLQVTGLVT